jgi:hypothetical protein
MSHKNGDRSRFDRQRKSKCMTGLASERSARPWESRQTTSASNRQLGSSTARGKNPVNHSWAKNDEPMVSGRQMPQMPIPSCFALDRTDGEGQPVTTWETLLTCTVDNCKHQGGLHSCRRFSFSEVGECKRNSEES